MRTPSQEASRVDALDPQKERVYAFETAWETWNNSDISLKDCRDAIRWACELYDVPTPRVRQHYEDCYSWCDVEKGVISMQARSRRAGRGGKNAATALHEAAHWIAYQLRGYAIQDHGPVFFGLFLDLLVGYRVAPRSALEAVAREHGVKW